MQATLLHGRLIEHAGLRPTAVALRSVDGRTVTYGELPKVLGAIQQWLRLSGVAHGDVLGVAMSNGVEAALTLLGGCLRATLTPMDPELSAAEMKAILEHIGAKGLITDEAHAARWAPVVAALGLSMFVMPFRKSGAMELWAGSEARSFDVPDADHIMLLHRTSGTTGTSKRVPLRALNLGVQARNTAESLGLTSDDRILEVMPLFHMHGFGCLSGTLYSGGTVLCTPGHDGRFYAERVRAFQPTWFSAAPAILADVARIHAQDPGLASQVHYRFIRSLSAAIDVTLVKALEQSVHAPVIVQYGLTEALSPVIANLPTGTQKAGSIGRPYRNEVWIVDPNGRDVAQGEQGEIVLRGEGVITGYAESEGVNAQAWFRDRFRTGDLGSVDKEGYVFITGRLKEEINRGGEKISPYEVEAAIAGHPGIRQAAVFATAHPTLGEEVAMAYVPMDQPVDVEDLRAWLQDRIAPHKAPKRFFPLEQLPTTATGKLKRVELAQLLGAKLAQQGAEPSGSIHLDQYERAVNQALATGQMGDGRSPDQVPSDYVERTVAMVWGQELGSDRVLLNDDFFLIGGDSLSGVRICARLKEMLGCEVQLVDLFKYPVLRRFAAQVGRKDHAKRWTNLAPIRLTGSAIPFICVHGDEGNYNLPRLISSDRPFIGFMHQGEDGRGMRHMTIKAIARHYVNELLEARPEGPYILAGFSTGGVICFEMAQRMRSLGKEVPLLILLDARGPKFNWWRYAPRTKLADLKGEFLRPRCERYLDKGMPIPFKLRNFYIINTYRRALERYRPKPYDGRVLYLRSLQRAHEPSGWGDLLLGDTHTVAFPGEHVTLLREPHVHAVAEHIETFLGLMKL